MKDIVTGTSAEAEMIVDKSDLAVNVGSGSLEVLATPVMTALMEKAACNCIAPFLEGDETTVGTEVCIKHISADPCGVSVSAEAEITAVNGREITFKVTAADSVGTIGEGIHKRFVVYGNRFTEKVKAKFSF